MHTTLHRFAALTAAAVAATALTVPLTATPASAAIPTELTFFVADSDSNGSFGLWKRTTPNGPPIAVVAESDSYDISDLATSADGSRLIYLRTTFSPAGTPLRDQVVVRDVSGRGVRTLQDTPATDSGFDFSPGLSPDGNTAVWTHLVGSATGTHFSLRRASVASGGFTTISNSLGGGTFLNGTTLLAFNLQGTPSSLQVTGGSPQPVTGLRPFASDFAVSPDHTKVAMSVDTSPPSGNLTAGLDVASYSVSGTGHVTIASRSTVVAGQNNVTPSFSRDGATLYFIKNNGSLTGPGDIWSAPVVIGSPPAVTVATAGDEDDVAIATTDDGTAPGSATVHPSTLTGTRATLHFTLPAASDLSGVAVKREASGTTTKFAFVPAPLTSYTDTGLVIGKSYVYTVTAVDRSGNAASGVSRGLTARQAFARFADPTSKAGTAAPFRVTLPSGTYSVSYRTDGTGAFTSWVNHGTGTSRVFGTGGTISRPGNSYAFRVQVFDAFGNSSQVTNAGTTVVPWDQTRASFDPGTPIMTASDRWLGSVRVLTKAGAAARLVVNGNRLQIIGERCTTCGVMDVYVDGIRVAGIDTRPSSRQARQVLYTRGLIVGRNHTIVVKARGTAGRPKVVLEASASAARQYARAAGRRTG